MIEVLHHDGVPEPLRSLLDAWRIAPTREEFRAFLAARFISGETGELSAREQGVVEERLSHGRPPAARAAFRAALREAFSSGRLIIKAELRARRAPILRWRRSTAVFFAAAAALLVWIAVGFFTPKGWHAVDSSIAGQLLVDGEAVAFADSVRLDHSLSHGGCLMQTTDDLLQVVCLDEGIVLEIIPGSEFKVFARQPGDGLLTLELSSGGIRVATCPKHGDCVRVRTPDGEITLAGRALGVTVHDEGTCLCVLDGRGTFSPQGDVASTVVASHTTAWLGRKTHEVVLDTEVLHHEESLARFAEVSDRYFY